MEDVLLSVITVCYNCSAEIEYTFESLNEQLNSIDTNILEYIIVDGASSDGTIELARKQVDYLRSRNIKAKLISEPDKGTYDAMNKGVAHAMGKWIHMLNAGDTFYSKDVLNKVIPHLKSDAAVLYGSTMRVHPLYSEKWIPGNVDDLKKTMIFCHQSVFVRRELDMHRYNLNYRCCADYDLMLRLYMAGYQFEDLGFTVSNYSLEGYTATSAMLDAFYDIYKIRREHGVISDNVLNKIKLHIGLFKRKIIAILPGSIRWKITGWLHKIRDR